MGIFDSLKKHTASVPGRGASQGVSTGGSNAVSSFAAVAGKGRNHTEAFTFSALPTNTEELKSLPQACLDSPFGTTALTLAVLCNYEHNPEATIEMLNFLKGPGEVSGFEKQFIREHLGSEVYKARSYFEGATPQNGYKPDVPYRIIVIENSYSFDNENWATLYVKSGGADNPRPMRLRRKPSTGQWFLVEIQCLADIRPPVEEDPWA